MKWCRQNREEGIKMRVETVRAQCAPPLAGQTCDERTLPGPYKAAPRKTLEEIRLGHVVTTTYVHE